MADRHTPDPQQPQGKRAEPMTAEQSTYLHTLCDETGEPFTDQLTRTQANEKIDELQLKTGRLPD
jgi:hypothetical protein